jgi:branched-chain amino acid transport system ATP-binding protein
MTVAADLAVARMAAVAESATAPAPVASAAKLAPVPSAAKLAAEETYFACRDMHAYYGESYVVQGISLQLREGEILALLGRNGAGKTSTLRTIARASVPVLKHGEIYLGGKAIHPLKSYQAAQSGIQLVPEDRRIIGGLTVEENLKLAQVTEPKGWPLERIYEHFPRLAERRRQEGTTLSGGEQQMLAVARALARELKLLLLDEPYEGLAPVIVHEIEKIVAGIKAQGITTIIVEQNAVAALELADHAVIMDHGQVVFSGSAAEVLGNAELRTSYLAV